MIDYERIAKELFHFIWDEIREGHDVDGGSAQEKLVALGLLHEQPCDPAENEWDADTMLFPVDDIKINPTAAEETP